MFGGIRIEWRVECKDIFIFSPRLRFLRMEIIISIPKQSCCMSGL